MSQVRHQLRHVNGTKSVDIADIVVAGRNQDCDLVLSEGNPSRRHAQLSVREGAVWLEDLGSTNGTFVNGREVREAVQIHNGDRIAFDAEEYLFVSEQEQDAIDPNATRLMRPDQTVVKPRATPEAALPGTPPPASGATSTEPPAAAAPHARPAPAPESPAAKTPESEPPAPPAEPPEREPEAMPPATAAPPTAAPPPSVAPAPAVAPTPEIVRGQAAAAHRPGSWADPENQNAQGTRLFDPEELKKLGAGAGSATAGADVAVDMPYLQVATGMSAGRGLKLEPGGQANVWEIGTDSERDIVLTDAGISGFHAKIVNEGARWKLIDQMSANGTYVNGQKTNVSYLKDGDRLRFGPVECVFRLPRSAAAASGGRRRSIVIAAVSFVVTVLILVAVIAFLG
jgi:pSer/pThr/pTyr-binding forkhead associated (FHA) protein